MAVATAAVMMAISAAANFRWHFRGPPPTVLGTECTDWVLFVWKVETPEVLYGQVFGGHWAYLDACI